MVSSHLLVLTQLQIPRTMKNQILEKLKAQGYGVFWIPSEELLEIKRVIREQYTDVRISKISGKEVQSILIDVRPKITHI